MRSTPGSALEQRQARSRLHDPREGRLLPARSARHATGPPLRDGADARTARNRLRVHHHEVASAVSAKSICAFDSLRKMADQVMVYKYVVKNVARRAGKSVTSCQSRSSATTARACTCTSRSGRKVRRCLPTSPLCGAVAARSWLHRRPAQARPGNPRLLRTDDKQLPRLVPGYEAPVNLVYSQRNRSACIRVPMYSESPRQAARVPPPTHG